MENILKILHRFILSVDANYMRLFVFKQILKLKMQFLSWICHVLKMFISYMWLVNTVLDSTDTKHFHHIESSVR